MRFLRQSLTGIFLVAVTLGVLVFAGQLMREAVEERMNREAHVPSVREREFAVNIIRATPQDITPVLTAFGQVQSQRNLEIRASAGGAIVEMAEGFAEGGHVTEGQVLMRIDPANAQAALARAKNDQQDALSEQRDAQDAMDLAKDALVSAQEQADLREKAFRRQVDLLARRVGTEAKVETAELAASSARAAVLVRKQSLATAKARIAQSKTRISRVEIAFDEAERGVNDTVIAARFTGTLSEVTVVEGGLVAKNERLAQLIDPKALEVAFRISTQAYARLLDSDGQLLKAAALVALDVGGIDLSAHGQITRDSAAVGDGQTGRLVFARLDGARGMKPGDFVSVEISEPVLSNVLRLPASALDSAGRVLAMDDEDRLEVLQVVLMRRQGDDVLVRGVNLAGRDIVAQRSPLLGEGIKVRALSATGETDVPKTPDMVELSVERRAKLVAFIQSSQRLPEEMRVGILAKLAKDKVPASMVARIEKRMGG